MTSQEKAKQKIASFYQGMRQGVQMYSHWKDGVQYVGTTGKTLQSALIEIDRLEMKDLDNAAYYG